MNQMGNLEKLGILVIVILVVVVGVVAITPKDQVDEALFKPEEPGVPAPIDPVAEEGTPQETFPGVRGNANQAEPGGVAGPEGGAPLPGPGIGGGVAPAPQPAPVPEATEYVVQKGDTGASIAKKTLGSANRWPEIVALNPGLDARRLKIDQKIRIPARAPETTLVPRPQTPATPAPSAQVPGTPPAGPVAQVPGPTVTPPTPEPAPAPAVSERTYVVQRGDTLSDIARRELGSASKVRLLQDANADVLRGSEVLRPGMKLRIPALAAAAPSAPSSPSRPVATPGTKTYKVQKGDTLISIASRHLGSGSRWKELLKANEAVLHGSTNLRVGMELTIPDDVSAR